VKAGQQWQAALAVWQAGQVDGSALLRPPPPNPEAAAKCRQPDGMFPAGMAFQ
jgi:hypothetical protein